MSAARSPLAYAHVAATPLCSRDAGASSFHSMVSISILLLSYAAWPTSFAPVLVISTGRARYVPADPCTFRFVASPRPKPRRFSDASARDQEICWCCSGCCQHAHHVWRFSSYDPSTPGITRHSPYAPDPSSWQPLVLLGSVWRRGPDRSRVLRKSIAKSHVSPCSDALHHCHQACLHACGRSVCHHRDH